MKILLVEDSTTQAILTIGELQQISPSINVEHVITKREALSAVLLRKFDLIVLDVSLPDGSGLEVCHHLKSSESTRSVPVVMYSAESLLNLRREAYAAGAEYCVTKGNTGDTTLNLLVTTILRRASRSAVA